MKTKKTVYCTATNRNTKKITKCEYYNDEGM